MAVTEKRPKAWQLGIIVFCLGGFLYGVSGPVMDGFDLYYPARTEVSRYADPMRSLEVGVDATGSKSRAVSEALGVLPVEFVMLAEAFGARVVTTNVEVLEQMNPDGTHISHTAGLYVPARRTAYVAADTADPGGTALHEMGHLFDDALGNLSRRDPFLRVYEAARDDASLGAGWRDMPEEFFARYYFSDARRKGLSARFPEAFEYFERLEQKVLACPRPTCFAEPAKQVDPGAR